MNLNSNPAREQLRELLAQADDSAADHVLWVTRTGEVQLSPVADDDPVDVQRSHPDMRLRFETFLKGNEYVGPEAANDDEWVAELFDRLKNEWKVARVKQEVALVAGF